MAFNKVNHAKNLPDTYRKDVESNNYKILETERTACELLRKCLSDIYNILDLDNARGKTLDMYGERVGQLRGNATDEQYIIMIKAKIMRSLVDGSYQSICDAICATFNCDQSAIWIKERESVPCTIYMEEFPVKEINEAGFSAQQALKIIRSLLPVCITLEDVMIGSFCFADNEFEYDNNAGFADDDGTIGGEFAIVYGSGEETELPI